MIRSINLNVLLTKWMDLKLKRFLLNMVRRWTADVEMVYETLRAEMKGRKAIGALAVATTWCGMFLTGRIHGNGLYDRQKQQLRVKQDGNHVASRS